MLPYATHGSGNITLVFLHYFGGSQRTWSHVVERLAQHHCCITVDLPGFGDAEWIRGYSVEQMSAAVLELLESLANHNIVLVGHSMGGKVSMVVAANPPSNVKQIILVGPSPRQPEPMTEDERATMTKANSSRETAIAFVNNGAAQTLSQEDETIGVEDVLRANPQAWQCWPQAGSREDWSNRIHRFGVRTDLVMGEKDKVIPPGFQREHTLPLVEASGGKFILIAEAAHMLPYESPAELSIAIQELVQSVRASTAHDGI